MRRADLDAVCRIDAASFRTPWLPAVYLTELSNRSACYLVAREGRDVIGYGGAWVVMAEAHITTLAVDPGHRGRRIGERILLGLMDEVILHGATHCTLEVRESNLAARALYLKLGFREAAVRRGYYSDNGENAVVMWADQIHAPQYRRRLADMREETLRRAAAR